MVCLADEAHGTHFYFGKDCPPAAMHAGADMSAVSMHKSGGSLTQSSLLLLGKNAVETGLLSEGHVRAVVNLTQTTSASYLLLSSLDVSRRKLATDGAELVDKVIKTAEYARSEIARIGGYYAFAGDVLNGADAYDFDKAKLSVHTREIGLAGIEVYDLLRDRFDIQIEFGDLGNILAYVSAGDKWKDIERLVSALAEIKRRFSKEREDTLRCEYVTPRVALSPKDAFYGEQVSLPVGECAGRISGEFVMCYPPGIPVLSPGELITHEILDYIAYSKEKGCSLTGAEDMGVNRLRVLTNKG
jgi:arginine/lysine/ornithine decarboxylase